MINFDFFCCYFFEFISNHLHPIKNKEHNKPIPIDIKKNNNILCKSIKSLLKKSISIPKIKPDIPKTIPLKKLIKYGYFSFS